MHKYVWMEWKNFRNNVFCSETKTIRYVTQSETIMCMIDRQPSGALCIAVSRPGCSTLLTYPTSIWSTHTLMVSLWLADIPCFTKHNMFSVLTVVSITVLQPLIFSWRLNYLNNRLHLKGKQASSFTDVNTVNYKWHESMNITYQY